MQWRTCYTKEKLGQIIAVQLQVKIYKVQSYTTKCKVDVKIFEQLRREYLINIKAVVMLKEIPDELIINWNQTGIKYVPVSEWTMAQYTVSQSELKCLEWIIKDRLLPLLQH